MTVDQMRRKARLVKRPNVPAGPKLPPAPGTKGEIMMQMILRPEGATEAEICAAVGWNACLITVRRVAAKAGIKLKRLRVSGEPSRYFGHYPSKSSD